MSEICDFMKNNFSANHTYDIIDVKEKLEDYLNALQLNYFIQTIEINSIITFDYIFNRIRLIFDVNNVYVGYSIG